MNKTLLIIHSSGRHEGSVTRAMTRHLERQISAATGDLTIIERDLADGMPFVNDAWIDANFTPVENRSANQKNNLAYSDSLVDEIKQADYVVIGSPIYNFSIPAVLKAWIDQVARARLTFKYTEDGPVGLMTGKQAFLVMASGGVTIESKMDFATPYLKHALGFIGIEDVTVVDSNQIKDAESLTQLVNGRLKNIGTSHV